MRDLRPLLILQPWPVLLMSRRESFNSCISPRSLILGSHSTLITHTKLIRALSSPTPNYGDHPRSDVRGMSALPLGDRDTLSTHGPYRV